MAVTTVGELLGVLMDLPATMRVFVRDDEVEGDVIWIDKAEVATVQIYSGQGIGRVTTDGAGEPVLLIS